MEIVGIISQGKEANVYFAYGEQNQPIAIKIYKIDIQSAKWMKNYIKGDPGLKKPELPRIKSFSHGVKKNFGT